MNALLNQGDTAGLEDQLGCSTTIASWVITLFLASIMAKRLFSPQLISSRDQT